MVNVDCEFVIITSTKTIFLNNQILFLRVVELPICRNVYEKSLFFYAGGKIVNFFVIYFFFSTNRDVV